MYTHTYVYTHYVYFARERFAHRTLIFCFCGGNIVVVSSWGITLLRRASASLPGSQPFRQGPGRPARRPARRKGQPQSRPDSRLGSGRVKQPNRPSRPTRRIPSSIVAGGHSKRSYRLFRWPFWQNEGIQSSDEAQSQPCRVGKKRQLQTSGACL